MPLCSKKSSAPSPVAPTAPRGAWEVEAYLALEAMQDGQLPPKKADRR